MHSRYGACVVFPLFNIFIFMASLKQMYFKPSSRKTGRHVLAFLFHFAIIQ